MNPEVSQLDSGLSGYRSATLGQSNYRACPMAASAPSILIHLRHAAALPIYTLALILSFSADLLGALAAKIVSEDRPR
jgi:hypothetical protein